MNKYPYLTIIGGGASGLMCASVAANRLDNNKKIIVLEKENKVGKKILTSGNGRCNLSNLNASAIDYHGSSTSIIDSLFAKYNPQYVIKYFESIGLLTKAEKDGRVYPRNKLATSVLNVLRNEIYLKSINEICNVDIKEIKVLNKGYEIITQTDNIITQKLVIATGGKCNHAGHETHSSSHLLKMLGYEMTKTSPSLSPVRVKNEIIKSLSGIRMEGKVSLIQNNRILKEEYGEIQFTNDALSGICVFNISRNANKEKDLVIRVSLLPEYSEDEIKKLIYKRIDYLDDSDLQNLFVGMFHKNIGLAILKECKINPDKKTKSLSDKDISSLAHKINNWDFDTLQKQDYKSAQVTAGGIPISLINEKTFETKDHKGLYIIGEALDVDGNCGGYNLQFAFASGLCVGENV